MNVSHWPTVLGSYRFRVLCVGWHRCLPLFGLRRDKFMPGECSTDPQLFLRDLRHLFGLRLNDQTLCIEKVFYGCPGGICGNPAYALALLWAMVEGTDDDPALSELCNLYNKLAGHDKQAAREQQVTALGTGRRSREMRAEQRGRVCCLAG